jgi:hypothetical protein
MTTLVRGFVSAFLLTVPCVSAEDDSPPVPSRAASTGDDALHQAITRALVPIERSALEYPKHRDCFSCHNQAIPALALTTARDRGFAVDPEALGAILDVTTHDLVAAQAAYERHEGQGGGVTRAGYALWTLALLDHPPDDTTRAVAAYVDDLIPNRDHWKTSSKRPPSESSPFTTTFVALKALSAYPVPADDDDLKQRTSAVSEWLRNTETKETEDHVFRLWSLRHLAVDDESLRKAVDELLSTQKPDGGWPQLPDGQSDPYATATALVALHLAGNLDTGEAPYARGLAFLLRTQEPDGTWKVESRSNPFQPYFESGFPYGANQFISIAASSWATVALTLALPESLGQHPDSCHRQSGETAHAPSG